MDIWGRPDLRTCFAFFSRLKAGLASFFPFKMCKAADGANKSLLYIVYPVELNVRASEHKVALIAFLKVILA